MRHEILRPPREARHTGAADPFDEAVGKGKAKVGRVIERVIETAVAT